MEKQTIIMLGICLLSLTLVQAMYSGEIFYADLTNEIQNLQTVECEIINNNSNLEGLNFTFNNTGYVIDLVVNYKPDNFTVLCLLNGYKIIEELRGSGGSCYRNTDYDWECSNWSECFNDLQNRTCKCYGNCGTTYGQPNLTQECFTIDTDIIDLDNQTYQENCSTDNKTTCIEEIEETGFFHKLKIWTNKVIDFLIFWK